MVITIFFEKTDKVLPFNNQHALNGVIHTILGKDNKYHDSFSHYSVSSIQGGKMSQDKKGIIFKDEPYIIVSSLETSFINNFLIGLTKQISLNSCDFYGLKLKRFETTDLVPHTEYDVIITNSPILIKNKDGFKLTCKNDGWLQAVKDNCIKKLFHSGIVDETFDIKVQNPENLKQKTIMVGAIFNPCTSAILTVYGKKNTRKTLYSLGIGNSTGSGFGSVSIFQNKKN